VTLRSISRWLEDRTGLGAVFGRLMRHPVPPGTGWLYVFGSATLMAFLLQLVTGAALATVYVPAAGDAYQSLQYITDQAVLGRFLRGMHYFGASAMMILITMHFIRVFLTGSYKYPREMNWLSGVLLLALTISMAFTGQVLRWDQDGVWSAVVGAEQASRVPLIGRSLSRIFLAGDNISGETLSHIYAYHVFVIPGLIIAGIALHLYLVLRHGISEPPKVDQAVDRATYRARYRQLVRTGGQPFWPDAIWRDLIFGTGVLLLIAALALIVGPRALGLPPDPSLIAKDPRPDWYMLWYFALLAVLPSGLENWLVWLLPLFAGIALIALPLRFPTGQRHPARRPWAWGFVVCALVAVGILLRVGIRSPWTPDVDAPPLPVTVVASDDSTIIRGATLFHDHACESCHRVSGYGGIYGPDLTYAGDRLSELDITLRISNGGHNMPAFGRYLSAADLRAIAAFVKSRTRASASAHDAR
jgi:ubiquinol-cytochrome c reductase cytochrome b subunit